MIYTVKPATKPTTATDNWTQGVWQTANEIELTNHMGARPEHFPRTCAKLLYDDQAIHVYFRVEDRYIRAVAEHYHDNVCRDSCVEFFFTPGNDLTPGYFNVEINCTGVLLVYHQQAIDRGRVPLELADCRRVEIQPSLPRRKIDPEIPGPLTWEIKCTIPYEMLTHYAPLTPPAPGVTWRANFYKCAENSHPHYLTWAPVDHPVPKFHLPEFFGTLEFAPQRA